MCSHGGQNNCLESDVTVGGHNSLMRSLSHACRRYPVQAMKVNVDNNSMAQLRSDASSGLYLRSIPPREQNQEQPNGTLPRQSSPGHKGH